MKALYSKNVTELKHNLGLLEKQDDVKSILMLLTNEVEFTPEVLNPILGAISKPVIGGVFYKLIFDCRLMDSGILLLPLPFYLKTEVFLLDEPQPEVFAKLESGYAGKMNEQGSVFVFIDAFAEYKASFVEELFNFFGFKFSFVGAGCGSEKYSSFPCVIHNSGMHENAAVIGYTNHDIRLGVGHGWSSVSVPLKVTESVDNKIISLNWEPAFEVYKRIVEEHSARVFDDTNFLDIAKSYPIGLMKVDDEMVVRDPFLVDNGSVICLDNVETGEYVSILHGTAATLIDGARQASLDCCENQGMQRSASSTLFCVDCISRVKFLGEAFDSEVAAISGDLPVNGVLSFGEIANVSHSFLEIYNKTIIVAKWEQIR